MEGQWGSGRWGGCVGFSWGVPGGSWYPSFRCVTLARRSCDVCVVHCGVCLMSFGLFRIIGRSGPKGS